MPGFSSLRVWGRLNIILVPIFAWLLSIAYSHFAGMLRDNAGGGLRRVAAKLAIVTAVYAVVLGVQLYLHLRGVRDESWVQYFNDFVVNEKWFILYGAAAFVAILVIMIVGAKVFLVLWQRLLWCLLVLVAAGEMRHTGAKMWSHNSRATPKWFQLNVANLDEMSFRYVRTDINNSITLSPSFNVGILENWYFARYVSFLNRTANEAPARSILLGVRDGTEDIFLGVD